MLSALPMTLYIDSETDRGIAHKLRISLSAREQDKVSNSMIGIYDWLLHSNKKNIPAPPSDLLNELVNRVFNHRQPQLDLAIDYVSVIIRIMPEILG